MLCPAPVMVSRVEFTITRLCVLHRFGIGGIPYLQTFEMLMESFRSPEIPDCIDFCYLGDAKVPISVGDKLEITPVSPFAKMSTNIHKSVLVASSTRVSISFSFR